MKVKPQTEIICAWLSITSYTYIASIGAEHFYGTIKFTVPECKDDIKLKKPLTQKEAAYLNKKESYFQTYVKGEFSEKFQSEKELILFGINWFKETYSDGILFRGDGCSVSAQLLLYWPKSLDKFAKRINKLADEWEKIGGYEGNYKRAEKIDSLWYKLAKSYLYPKLNEIGS